MLLFMISQLVVIYELFLHHDLYACLNKICDTMDDTFRAYALAFTVKTKIQYVFVRMLYAGFFGWNILKSLIG